MLQTVYFKKPNKNINNLRNKVLPIEATNQHLKPLPPPNYSSIIRYLSHELRTPTSVIEANLTFIDEELTIIQNKFNPRLVENIFDIKDAFSSIKFILDELVLFEKIVTNEYYLSHEFVSFSNFIVETISKFEYLGKNKGITINLDVSNFN